MKPGLNWRAKTTIFFRASNKQRVSERDRPCVSLRLHRSIRLCLTDDIKVAPRLLFAKVAEPASLYYSPFVCHMPHFSTTTVTRVTDAAVKRNESRK